MDRARVVVGRPFLQDAKNKIRTKRHARPACGLCLLLKVSKQVRTYVRTYCSLRIVHTPPTPSGGSVRLRHSRALLHLLTSSSRVFPAGRAHWRVHAATRPPLAVHAANPGTQKMAPWENNDRVSEEIELDELADLDIGLLPTVMPPDSTPCMRMY